LKDRLHRTTGEVRFGKIEAFDEAGQLAWSFKTGETARFEICYEVLAPIESLYILFRVLTPHSDLDQGSEDHQIVANFWLRVTDDPVKAGAIGKIELILPELKLKAGDFPLYIVAASANDKINYDVIDANVNLPTLRIKPNSGNRLERLGYVALDHRYAVL
jgi:hypothetical protein